MTSRFTDAEGSLVEHGYSYCSVEALPIDRLRRVAGAECPHCGVGLPAKNTKLQVRVGCDGEILSAVPIAPPSLWRRPALLAVVVFLSIGVIGALVGCSEEDSRKTSAAAWFAGHGVTFAYPNDWEVLQTPYRPRPLPPIWEFVVSPDRFSGNWVWFVYYPASVADVYGVTPGTFDEGFVRDAVGSRPITYGPTAIEIAGVPGLEFGVAGIIGERTGQRYEGRVVALFDEDATYLIAIQYEPASKEEMLAAWETTLARLDLPDPGDPLTSGTSSSGFLEPTAVVCRDPAETIQFYEPPIVDDFETPCGVLEVHDEADHMARYADGRYEVVASDDAWSSYVDLSRRFEAVSIAVDVTFETPGSVSLICENDFDLKYWFTVATNGSRLAAVVSRHDQDLEPDRDEFWPPQPGQRLRLELRCSVSEDGMKLQALINGETVDEMTDTNPDLEFVDFASVAIVFSANTAGADASFSLDNLVIDAEPRPRHHRDRSNSQVAHIRRYGQRSGHAR